MNIFTAVAKLREERRQKARERQEKELKKLRLKRQQAEEEYKLHKAIQKERAIIKAKTPENRVLTALKGELRKARQNRSEGRAYIGGRELNQSERNIYKGVGRNIWDNDKKKKSIWEKP